MYKVLQGDSLEVLQTFDDDSIDSLISDPPAGISFMGKKWDTADVFQVQMRVIFEECRRTLKPGAHGLIWALPRTSHWTATALEEAGFEIRDVITHVFGSGFPKSHNIGDGWGSALKPASEHWILVRKPLRAPNIANNVLEYGTGGINIDGCRIGCNDKTPFPVGYYGLTNFRPTIRTGDNSPNGRFPANFILSHHPDCKKVGTRDEQIQINKLEQWSGFGEKERPDYESETHTSAIDVYECIPGCPVQELDKQSGICAPGGWGHVKTTGFGKFGGGKSEPTGERINGTAGGASRFYATFKEDYECGLGQINETEEDTSAGEKKEVVKSTLSSKADGSGNNIMGRFLPHTIFITKTKTHAIMIFPILSVWKNTLIGTCIIESENNTKLLTEKNIESAKVVKNGKLLITTTNGKQELTKGIVKNVVGENFENGVIIIENGTINITENTEPQGSSIFYCAKPSKAERDDGLSHMEEKEWVQFQTGGGKSGKPSSISEGRNTKYRNTHPTVKPVKLMRYLCRLITPKGGTVLDPFLGSGTTGIAAIQEDFDFIGIEREPEYVEISEARLKEADYYHRGRQNTLFG